MDEAVRLSKTLSFWLRHKPEAAGLALDAQGWTDVDAILLALARQNANADIEALISCVENNDKQRFELSPDLSRIRARQGHSTPVELALPPRAPLERLFHGTVERFLASITSEGLKKMRRQHVHLSEDVVTAQRVGARRGAAIVLIVDAARMHASGYEFFRTENGVWLTDHVPPDYIVRQSG